MKNKHFLILTITIYLIASFIQLTFDFTKWSLEARVFCCIPPFAILIANYVTERE